jgi:hypothetical protein
MSSRAWRLSVLTTAALTLIAAPAAAATTPSRPHIGTASSGVSGGTINATARWSAPPSDGGAPITKYQVIAQKLNASDRVVGSYRSIYKGPAARGLAMTLPSGRYQFRVVAWNSVGASASSPHSNFVTAR